MFSIELIFFLFVILFSAILHEIAHGVAALLLGDETAKNQGRLTLNPIPHIDPLGTIIVPLLLLLSPARMLFGWAKPVPFNPYNLKNQRWGPSIVGVAGPLTNLTIAVIFALFIRFIPGISEDLEIFLGIIVIANIILGVFNLLPIPPLDGSKVLFAILPPSMMGVQNVLERYGFMILLFFIFFSGGFLFKIVDFFSILLLGARASL
jgi:Zn-dependent protease